MAALAAVAYAWWVTGLRPFSGLATAAVVGGGAAAVVLGRLALPPRPTMSQTTKGDETPSVAPTGGNGKLVAWPCS